MLSTCQASKLFQTWWNLKIIFMLSKCLQKKSPNCIKSHSVIFLQEKCLPFLYNSHSPILFILFLLPTIQFSYLTHSYPTFLILGIITNFQDASNSKQQQLQSAAQEELFKNINNILTRVFNGIFFNVKYTILWIYSLFRRGLLLFFQSISSQ